MNRINFVLLFIILFISTFIGCNNNPLNSTSWRGYIDNETTTLTFKESHVVITTPSNPDGDINYPYTYKNKVATIETGYEILTATFSGSILTLNILNKDGEIKESFSLYKQ